MYALSKFSFVQNFNKEKLTRQEAMENGVSLVDIEKCDSDGDGNLSIDEILANSDVCDKILAKINSEQASVQNSINELQGEKAQVETDEKSAEKQPEKTGAFVNFLKQPAKDEGSTFSIAA